MLSVLLISIFGQFSGNGLGYCECCILFENKSPVTKSSPTQIARPFEKVQNVIYENLGYTDVKTQLALNLGGSFLGAVCGVTGALFADRMVRPESIHKKC